MTDLIDADATATGNALGAGRDQQRDQPRDQQRRDALAERLFGAFTLGSELLTIDLGRRLGLYETVHAAGSVTAAELAQRSGIHERYAREWLEQQAAAGIIDVVAGPGIGTGSGTGDDTGAALTRRFALPAAHVPVLVDPDHPSNVLGFAPFLTGFALTLPAVVQAYRTGADPRTSITSSSVHPSTSPTSSDPEGPRTDRQPVTVGQVPRTGATQARSDRISRSDRCG